MIKKNTHVLVLFNNGEIEKGYVCDIHKETCSIEFVTATNHRTYHDIDKKNIIQSNKENAKKIKKAFKDIQGEDK